MDALASPESGPVSKPVLRPASKRTAQPPSDVQQELAEATQRLAVAARDVVRLAQLACQRSAGGDPGPAVVAAARVLNSVKLAQGPVQVHACLLGRQMPSELLNPESCSQVVSIGAPQNRTSEKRTQSGSQQPTSAAVHASRQPGARSQVPSSGSQVTQPQQARQPRQARSHAEQRSSPGTTASSPDAGAQPGRRQAS